MSKGRKFCTEIKLKHDCVEIVFSSHSFKVSNTIWQILFAKGKPPPSPPPPIADFFLLDKVAEFGGTPSPFMEIPLPVLPCQFRIRIES